MTIVTNRNLQILCFIQLLGSLQWMTQCAKSGSHIRTRDSVSEHTKNDINFNYLVDGFLRTSHDSALASMMESARLPNFSDPFGLCFGIPAIMRIDLIDGSLSGISNISRAGDFISNSLRNGTISGPIAISEMEVKFTYLATAPGMNDRGKLRLKLHNVTANLSIDFSFPKSKLENGKLKNITYENADVTMTSDTPPSQIPQLFIDIIVIPFYETKVLSMINDVAAKMSQIAAIKFNKEFFAPPSQNFETGDGREAHKQYPAPSSQNFEISSGGEAIREHLAQSPQNFEIGSGAEAVEDHLEQSPQKSEIIPGSKVVKEHPAQSPQNFEVGAGGEALQPRTQG